VRSVVDASVVVEYLIGGPALTALYPLFTSGGSLFAPSLLDLEICNALRNLERGGQLTRHAAGEALLNYRTLGIQLYPHEPLLDRIWELRSNLTPYDASYLALTELLDAELWSRDSAFCAVRPRRGKVRFLIT